MVHKRRTRLFAAALCALWLFLLAGCSTSALPAGVTQDSVKAEAQATVEQLNSRDYSALLAHATPELAKALSADKLAEAWEPVLAGAGAFDSVTKISCIGKDGYAVAVVRAKYASATLTFTLSYTADGALGGLYFK